MFGRKGFHVSATGAIQGHHGPLVVLLQTPQYAVWDGKNTHVVEIDRGKSKGFGFSYTVKLGKVGLSFS